MAKKKVKSNIYKFLFFVTFIILISFVIAVYIKYPEVYNFSKVDNSKIIIPNLTKTTWVNKIDGAMLTFNVDNTFVIEIPSVDSSEIIKGKYMIKENNISVTFDPKTDNCDKESGNYIFKIATDKLEFTAVSDKCDSRKYRWTAGWFKL